MDEFFHLLGEGDLDLSDLTAVFRGPIPQHQTGTRTCQLLLLPNLYAVISNKTCPIIRYICRREPFARSLKVGQILLRGREGPGLPRPIRGDAGIRSLDVPV